MEGSALTDYIFPQRKLELIWPVTHMPGCQLQHTTPDSTPHRAQLAPALPAHRCGPQGPSSERQGSGGHRARRVRGSWWYFRTRRAHACTHTHVHAETHASTLAPGTVRGAHAYTRVHARDAARILSKSFGSQFSKCWGKSNERASVLSRSYFSQPLKASREQREGAGRCSCEPCELWLEIPSRAPQAWRCPLGFFISSGVRGTWGPHPTTDTVHKATFLMKVTPSSGRSPQGRP